MLDTRLLLSGLDLSEAEIDIYLAMLQGAATPREIVKATGRSRPTVYYALGSLERRGLLSKTGLPDERSYRVEPLDRLKRILQQKEDQDARPLGARDFPHTPEAAETSAQPPKLA